MATLLTSPARIIGVLALAAGLVACSAIKLGYNALPEFAYWWLDGYIDFSDAQTPQVRDELARLHAWHRSNELPQAAEMLGRMEQLAAGPISAGQACAFVTEVQARLNLLARQAEPALAATALALDAEQLKHLERKYGNNNADWRKNWIDVPPGERAEKRFKQAVERFEMIYGTLDDPQRAVLRQWTGQSIFDPQRILADRQRRQQDLLRILRGLAGTQATPAEAGRQLRDYLERAQRSPDPEYRRYQQQLLDETCRGFAAVHESTTAQQREQAVRRLRAYQRDLRELSAQR
jgi:hypothetical protein